MGKHKRPAPPKPGLTLYNNLFVDLSQSETIGRISEGIIAVISNANRLLEDVSVLEKSGRLASAGFLLATADEEMAKVYILIDMCRLNFENHKNFLINLCRGFYDHVIKYAYRKIIEPQMNYRDMDRVREFWVAETTKYWPSPHESGEPNFPHDTFFHRELPLYVDFIEYDQEWHIPDDAYDQYRFKMESGGDAFSKSKKFFERIKTSQDKGFFKPQVLSILNKEFKTQIISGKTLTDDIITINAKIMASMPKEIKSDYLKSSIHEWPLYYFVETIK